MSLLWSAVYSLLWFEIAILTLLLLPYISTHLWCRIAAKARGVYDWADSLIGITWYFWTLVSVLAIIFASSLYEMRKYSDLKVDHKDTVVDAMTRQQDAIHVFRSQRNVYISGLTLFLALLIRRVLSLILKLGKVRSQREELKAAQLESEKIETKKEN